MHACRSGVPLDGKASAHDIFCRVCQKGLKGVSPLDYRQEEKRPSRLLGRSDTFCGLLRPAGAGSRDLLAMTSHNRCTTQRRLILPRSASGGLRQGRFPALRFGAICCIELCDVMPSPEAGGRSRARPQYIPRCGMVTNALASWRVVLVAGLIRRAHPSGCPLASLSPPGSDSAGDPPPCRGRPENISRSMLCPATGARIERERKPPPAATNAPAPPGLITLVARRAQCGRRSFVAVVASTETRDSLTYIGGIQGWRKIGGPKWSGPSTRRKASAGAAPIKKLSFLKGQSPPYPKATLKKRSG